MFWMAKTFSQCYYQEMTTSHTIYKNISTHTKKKHVYDIQNMCELLIPTIVDQHTLCTNVSEIQEYGFITLILLCTQHVFDSQNMLKWFLLILILHHTLGYSILCQHKNPCFWHPKHASIANPNHYGLVQIMKLHLFHFRILTHHCYSDE
jgi:hypothetical protein